MDKDFTIELTGFNEGFSSLAHIDTRTFTGNKGQASEMLCDVISKPGFIMQGPGLANLTNGSEAGVVDELIRFILDKPTSATVTFAIGATKLFKLSSTAVTSGGTPSWPQTVTGMTEGESIVRMGVNLFVFYNKSSGGDIALMPLANEVIDPDWGSSTDAALEKAPHPSAVKEDRVLFGNGQYVGVYIGDSNALDINKLDFKAGAEVADIVFNSGFWWIAINYGEGRGSQVYIYDGSAISNVLSDEAAVGAQEIGFLYVKNGVVYIAYKDKSSDGYCIGWISGRQIKPLRYFTGSLPDHRQKTLYKDVIMFLSSSHLWTMGASVEQLPIQISKLASGGYTTLGAVAAPFGTPLVSSTDGSGHFRLVKLSGYATDSMWKSISVDITSDRLLGKIHTLIVITSPLNAAASCTIQLESNQGAETSSAFAISGANKIRHVFKTVNLRPSQDIRVLISYSGGDTAYTCPIRKIIALGNFVET
jgi:hypothetical protein